MRLADVVDATTAAALRAAWLHAELEPVSETGRRAAQNVAPFRPGEEREARERAQRIADLARAIEAGHVDALRDALRLAPDPIAAIARCAMGEVLSDAQFLELMRFLDAVARIDALLGASSVPLPYASDASREVARVLEGGRAGKFGFYLSENFDTALAQARARAQAAQAEYESSRGRLAQRVAAELRREEIAGAEFIVMREDAPELPRGVRVVREAPTYYLCELELDDAALEALRKRDAAADLVAAAEETVRARVSARIRDRLRELEDVLRAIGMLDVELALVRFTQQYACCVPEIVEGQELAFEEARYLPLQRELESQGRRYEPISVRLQDVAVLTGPNMGGKSVALRTCGFIAALVAFGIPVPAASARSCLFEQIAWLGIGAHEELGGLLSSFAHEVVRLKELLARAPARMLLLIDEFARTTTPSEGKALLVALIRGLRRRGRLALMATHLAGIAAEAGVQHFAVRGLRDVPKTAANGDLHAALAALAGAMDYAVVEVSANAEHGADAIVLAELLGLDEDLVADAKKQTWIP